MYRAFIRLGLWQQKKNRWNWPDRIELTLNLLLCYDPSYASTLVAMWMAGLMTMPMAMLTAIAGRRPLLACAESFRILGIAQICIDLSTFSTRPFDISALQHPLSHQNRWKWIVQTSSLILTCFQQFSSYDRSFSLCSSLQNITTSATSLMSQSYRSRGSLSLRYRL